MATVDQAQQEYQQALAAMMANRNDQTIAAFQAAQSAYEQAINGQTTAPQPAPAPPPAPPVLQQPVQSAPTQALPQVPVSLQQQYQPATQAPAPQVQNFSPTNPQMFVSGAPAGSIQQAAPQPEQPSQPEDQPLAGTYMSTSYLHDVATGKVAAPSAVGDWVRNNVNFANAAPGYTLPLASLGLDKNSPVVEGYRLSPKNHSAMGSKPWTNSEAAQAEAQSSGTPQQPPAQQPPATQPPATQQPPPSGGSVYWNPTNGTTNPPLPNDYTQRGREYNYTTNSLQPAPPVPTQNASGGYTPAANLSPEQRAEIQRQNQIESLRSQLPAAPASSSGQLPSPTRTPVTPGAAGDIHDNPEHWPFPRLPQTGDNQQGSGASTAGPPPVTIPNSIAGLSTPTAAQYDAQLQNVVQQRTPIESGNVRVGHADPAINALLQEAQAGYARANAANEARYSQVLSLQDNLRNDLFGIGGIYPALESRYRDMELDTAQRLQQADSAMSDLVTRGDSERQNIMEGYLNRQDTVLDLIDSLGESEGRDINRLYQQRRSEATQGLANRGLGNTTVANTVDSGITRQQTADQGRLQDRLRGQQAGYASQLSGDALSANERLLSQQQQAIAGYAQSLKDTALDWANILGQGNSYSERMADNYAQHMNALTNFMGSRQDIGPSINDMAGLLSQAGQGLGFDQGLNGQQYVSANGGSSSRSSASQGTGGNAAANFRSTPNQSNNATFQSGDTINRGMQNGVQKYTTVYTNLPGGVNYNRSGAADVPGEYDPWFKNSSKGSFTPSFSDPAPFYSLADSRGQNSVTDNRNHTIWNPSNPIYGLGYSLGGSEFGNRSFF